MLKTDKLPCVYDSEMFSYANTPCNRICYQSIMFQYMKIGIENNQAAGLNIFENKIRNMYEIMYAYRGHFSNMLSVIRYIGVPI